MRDNIKQIKEMAQVIIKAGESYYKMPVDIECANTEAIALYTAGYRKQSETAREILKELKFLYVERQKEYTNWDGNKINAVATVWLNADIECIAAQYGVEVEE